VVAPPAGASPSGAAPSTARLWHEVAGRPAPNHAGHDVSIHAVRMRTFTLDRTGMASALTAAPLEFTSAARSTPMTIAIPGPSQGFQRFAIQESPVMEPGLALKHPEIKTYNGRGIDDPAATIRLDLTPLGFHASVRGQQGTWFVDPYYHLDQSVYAVYRGGDLQNDHGSFVDHQVKRLVSSQDLAKGEDGASTFLSSGTILRVYRLALITDPGYANYFGPSNVTAAKATLMNRVDQVYEDETSIRMVLVANNDLLNLNTYAKAIEPNGPCGTAACFTLSQITSCSSTTRARFVIGQIIGAGNYDIGHLALGAPGGGVANLGVVGRSNKAGGCTGIPEPDGDYYAVDYVAHEMGHQFAGNHTFNGNQLNCSGGNRSAANSVEPGSGSSIMAYAGICDTDDLQPHSDPYWSQRSHQEITTYVTSSQAAINEVQTASLSHFGGGNEVQVVTFGPGFSTTTSSFQVRIGGNDSALIGSGGLAYNNTNIQTAINGIAGFAGTVTVTGAAATGFTVTYGGASAGTDVPNIQLVNLSCSGCFNAVDETNHGGANDSFTLSYAGGPDSTTITNGTTYTATGIQTALQGVSEVQQVALSGYDTDGDTYTLTYDGNDSVPITRGQNNTAAGIQAAIQGGNESQAMTTTGFVAATSSYQIQYNGNNSVTLGVGGLAINTANVQAAITGISGFPVGGTVTASGVSATTGNFTATFAGTLAQTDVSALSIVNCAPSCSGVVRENVKGTPPIGGIVSGGTVAITGLLDTGYTVTFGGFFQGTNPHRLSVTNVSGSSGSVSTTTQGSPGILPPGATATVAGFAGAAAPSSQGFQVTYGAGLGLTNVPTLLGLTNLSAGSSGFVGETDKGGAVDNQGGPATGPTGNSPPVVTAPSSYTIPYRTPFALTGGATDVDGDTVTYMWEQNDIGATAVSLVSNTKNTGPLFRQFGTALDMSLYDVHQYNSPGENHVTTDPTRVFPDMAQILSNNTDANTGSCPAAGPAPVDPLIIDCYSEYLPKTGYPGPMHFRLTARDGHPGGGGVNSADTTVNLAAGTGPFLVTSQSSPASYDGGSSQNVTWNVAGTDAAPISTATVTILLSTDGGASFPTVLAAGVPNNGLASVTLPDVATSHARVEVQADGNVYFDVNDSDFTIKGSQTISFDPIPDHTYGDPDFSVSASASSGLPVSFTVGGSDQCTITGASVSITGAGSCSVTAHQAGDATHQAAPDVVQTFAINQADQTISFGSIPDHTYGDADFNVTASASSGLAVSFSATGDCTVTGSTVSITGAGSCTVTASQPGDANYNAAADVDRSFDIEKADQTITFNVGDHTFGDPDFQVSATSTSGLGVSFSIVSGNCTITGDTVHITGAGNCKVRASQPGDANYNAAPDVDRVFNISQADQSITFDPLPDKTYGDADFAVSATASSGLAVSFSSGGNCTVAGSTVHITGAGSCTVTASQLGDSDYNPASDVSQSFDIEPADQTITFNPLADKTYGDADFNVHATASSGLAVSFSAAGDCTVTGNTVHITGAGSCTVTASQPGDSNYNPATDVDRSFTISKGNQSITFPTIPNQAFGTPDFDPGASASSGLPITYSATSGPCTIVSNKVHLTGVGKCKVRAFQSGDANWNPAIDVSRQFKVTPAATTTALTGTSPVPPGGTIHLHATVSSAAGGPTTGTVQFLTAPGGTLLATVPISAGTADADVTAPGSPGTLKIYALYVPAPGGNWKTSKSPKVVIHVQP
jgi:hypothetical protein